MAESAKPWDAVFDAVRPVRELGKVYAPPLTAADFDQIDLGVPLPASYRAFALRFGLGGLLGTSLRLLQLHRSEEEAKTRVQHGTVVQDTAFLRSLGDPVADSEMKRQLSRCICFACQGFEARKAKHVYIWDTRESRDQNWSEYPVFRLRLKYVPGVETKDLRYTIRVAENFPEFIQSIYSDRDTEPQRAPTTIPYSPLVLRVRQKPGKAAVVKWLAWNNNTVRDLALSIRDAGRTDAFPILADALEEAGCTNADLLDSCRTGDPDIDGAWVLQVLLGRAKE